MAEGAEPVCVRVVVEGRVQGVAFRVSTRQEAVRLGLCGWVRNCADGNVEAWFEGEAAAVAAAVQWCHRGPGWARVDRVATHREPASGMTAFQIR